MNKHLILGPPGTGKTTELLNVVDREIAAGTFTSSIAYISFTRKATYEAQSRAIEKFKLGRGKLPYFKTIHSLCYSELGITKSQLMQRDNYNELGKILGIEFTGFYSEEEGLPTGAATGDKLLFIDSYSRAAQMDLKEAWQKVGRDVAVWQEVKQFSEALRTFKQANGLIDFTDMLEQYTWNGGALPVEVMMIDEAQDLSLLQWKVVELMMGSCRDVYIAGDDDQAIYKWSGADVQYFLNLPVQNKKILDISYRLPKAIFEFCCGIAERIPDDQRYKKFFVPTKQTGKVVRIQEPNQIEIKGDETWLLLARNVYLLKELEEIAHRAGTVYECRHRKSVTAPHINAILIWERLRKGEAVTREEVAIVYHLSNGKHGPVRACRRGFVRLAILRGMQSEPRAVERQGKVVNDDRANARWRNRCPEGR
ncbi:MAG: UvrD-helicase domain-containing protein [Proteobacteria bacterium]|nr:UvrD-helicase domain-containing protein [Pseudomonadota bacterium]